MNTLNSIVNKSRKAAALRCRDFAIYRKINDGVTVPHIMRTYKLTRLEIEKICKKAKRIEAKYKKQYQQEGVIRHPLDHDICNDLFLELSGQRDRPYRDENILNHPGFNNKDLTVSISWSNKDIDLFCEQYINQVATLLRSTNSEREVRELKRSLESDFFKVCCKVAGFRPDEMVYLIKRKLKQYKS